MRAALLLAEASADAGEIKAATAGAEAARVAAKASSTEALIPHLKPGIEKLRCEIFGSRSERKVPLLAQLELQLEDLAATATEDELAAVLVDELPAIEAALILSPALGREGRERRLWMASLCSLAIH